MTEAPATMVRNSCGVLMNALIIGLARTIPIITSTPCSTLLYTSLKYLTLSTSTSLVTGIT